MGVIIGMDEAGYGPNFGPLVISITAWEVPGRPRDFDFWKAFDSVAHQSPADGDERLHIADSKQVYSPARGIGRLERSVLAAFQLSRRYPASFRELWQTLSGEADLTSDGEPWFDTRDLKVPFTEAAHQTASHADRWRDCCEQKGIRLRAIASDIVFTNRFNRLTNSYDSKGQTLSRMSMQLLRRVWDPALDEPALIIADKHGGRNRYDGLLDEILDGQMIFRGKESTEVSTYRIGKAEIRFQTKAEAHFPVALASMVSKYMRELSMTLFNQFWGEQVPGLKPTAGYPGDAQRFKDDIAEAQARLGIDDAILWRNR